MSRYRWNKIIDACTYKLFICNISILAWGTVCCIMEAIGTEEKLFGLVGGMLWEFVKLIPFWIVGCLFFSAIHWFAEEWVFPIIHKEDGLHRKNVTGYYIWRELLMRAEAVAWILLADVRCDLFYHTLRIALIWQCFQIVLFLFPMLGFKRRVLRWLNDETRRDKKICTYITANDVTPIRARKGMKALLKPYGVAKVCPRTFDLFWESKDILVCPHWFYKEYYETKVEGKHSRFILLMNGIVEMREPEIETVIDECMDAEIAVAEYTFADEFERWGEMTNRPIKRFHQKKKEDYKVAQYITNAEDIIEVPYFKQKVFTHCYPKSMADRMKYEHADEELEQIAKISDNTECFYRLLKLVEYVWHYRALAEVAQSQEKREKMADKPFQSSLGLWEKYQNKIKHNYMDKEIVEAYRLVKALLDNVPCGNTKVSYAELCQVITQLRNRYVGHGTMAFSVSQELLDAVKELIGVVLEVFYQQEDVVIDEEQMFVEQIPFVYYRMNGKQTALCLLAGYTGKDMKIAEYLDYQNAAFCSEITVEYQLNYREEMG